MSAPYTPTGLTPPVPTITLPQDVIDAVVVSMVNPPFQNLADNIAWQLLAQKNVINGANYGVLADGTTDNATMLDAAAAALVAAGGGTLLLPPGTIRSTTEFAYPASVSIYAPGTAFLIDSPGAICFRILAGTADQKPVIYGVECEAAQVNSGTIFVSNGLETLTLVRCSCNVIDNKLQGPVQSSLFGPCIIIEPELHSHITGGNAFGSGVALTFHDGLLEMDAAAAADLIATAGTLLIVGTLLTQLTPSVTGHAFISQSSSVRTRVVGVQVSRGTAATYLLNITGGFAYVDGCDLGETLGIDNAYLYTSGVLATGSFLQQRMNVNTAVGTATVEDAASSSEISFTSVSAPTITLPHILFLGQELDLVIKNHHGSGSWAGAPVFIPQAGTDDVKYSSAGLDGLADDGLLTMRWRAMRDPVSSEYIWTQIGAPIQI